MYIPSVNLIVVLLASNVTSSEVISKLRLLKLVKSQATIVELCHIESWQKLEAAPHQPHHKSHNMLVFAISLGEFIQGTTQAIPVVVSLFAFITAVLSFVISSFML
jgi:hypothetical protein